MTPVFNSARDDAMGNLDAVGLLEAIAKRLVNADEIRDAAMNRAQEANEHLNAIVSWAPGGQPGTGPFAGIPSVVKDNEDLAGLATTYGSRATSRTASAKSSVFVSQYLELGFSVIGKSTLPEFGLTATTEPLATGPTRNPRNLGHSAGGSSGGSGALVAAGVVPIAHANDGGGSIRIPASCCGLVGLKPSRGRLVSNPELERMPVAIATQGIVTRTVRDTAFFYSEIEKIHNSLPPIGHITSPNKQRLRIAVADEGMTGLPVAGEVSETVRAAAKLCQDLGHHVEVIPFPYPDHFGHDFLRYWAAMAFAIEHGGKRAFSGEFDKDKLEPLTNGLSGLFRHVAIRMPATLVRLRRFSSTYAAAFANHDVILTPVLSHTAPPIGYLAPDLDPTTHLIRLLRYASFTAVQNVSGAPAISLPLGVGEDNLPIGVQAAAPFGHEARLIELAYELEESAPWELSAAGTRTTTGISRSVLA